MILPIEENLSPHERLDYIYFNTETKEYIIHQQQVFDLDLVHIATLKVPSFFTAITKNNYEFNTHNKILLQNED